MAWTSGGIREDRSIIAPRGPRCSVRSPGKSRGMVRAMGYRNARRRNEFDTTDTELSAIAALANTGEISQPVQG